MPRRREPMCLVLQQLSGLLLHRRVVSTVTKSSRLPFSTLPYFICNSSHMVLGHMTELTRRNLYQTMAVMNNVHIQLSKDFDGLYLAKEILIFALSPRVIHNIAFSIVLSIYFAQKTNEM